MNSSNGRMGEKKLRQKPLFEKTGGNLYKKTFTEKTFVKDTSLKNLVYKTL